MQILSAAQWLNIGDTGRQIFARR